MVLEQLVEFKTIQTSVMNTLINTLKESLNEVVLHFRNDKFFVNQATAGGSLIIDLQITNPEEYICHKEIDFGIDLIKLSKIMSTISSFDKLCWRIFNDDNIPKMEIIMSSDQNNKVIRTIINAIDIASNGVQIPRLEHIHIVDMPSKLLKSDCNVLKSISDEIEIIINNNMICLSSGDKNHDTRMVIEYKNGINNAKNNIFIDTKDNDGIIVQGLYHLKHISEFMKCASINNSVKVAINKKSILNIKCQVADLGELQFFMGNKNN